MTCKLVDAVEDDLAFIISVYNNVIPGRNVTADLEPVTIEDWMPWFKNHDSLLRPVWILDYNGICCGWMSFSDFKSRKAYQYTAEISIYLDESHRGKGLGARFIETGLDEMKKRGLKKVMAVIYAANEHSVRLFHDLGFCRWGLLPGVCEVEGKEKDVVILGKKL